MIIQSQEPNATGSDRPRVTFALVSYNQERYVSEAVVAALRQTYSPLQILISDDCSSDSTWPIVQALVAEYAGPHEITLNRNPRNLGSIGIGAHINRVFGLARGDLIVLAAGDDISRPDRTVRLVDAWVAAGMPCGSIHSAARLVSDDPALSGRIRRGRDIGDTSLCAFVRSNRSAVVGCAHAVTRDLFDRFGPLPDDALFEDMQLAFRSFVAGRICYVDEPLVDYRVHGASLTGAAQIQDPARWTHWMDGLIRAYRGFVTDYRKYVGSRTDPRVLLEIERSVHRAERAKLLTSSNVLDRLRGGLAYSQEFTVADRIAFLLRAFRLEKSLAYRVLGTVLRIVRRLAGSDFNT